MSEKARATTLVHAETLRDAFPVAREHFDKFFGGAAAWKFILIDADPLMTVSGQILSWQVHFRAEEK